MAAIVEANEIISTREFDFSREAIFKAWADPELLARWWGPNGFTSTFHEFDLRPGGVWRFVMHGPDGTDYPNLITFVEIVPSERIVLHHPGNHDFYVTAAFEDLDGRTGVTFRQRFTSAEELEAVKSICIEGNEQNFDRLHQLLAEMTDS